MFLFNKKCVFSYASIVFIGIYSSYNYSFFSLVLEGFGLSESTVGYIFAIPCFTYAISSISVAFIIQKFPRRLFIFASFILVSIALLLLSPMKQLPNELWIILLGYAILGVGQGFIFIPLLPEIIESVQHE